MHAPTASSKPCNRSIRMPDPTTNDPLVLQLRLSLTAVVSGCGFGLVFSAPEGPRHDEAGPAWRAEQETRQKVADLGHRRQQRGKAHQAAAGTTGLLSFALPQVARRRSAASRARKA